MIIYIPEKHHSASAPGGGAAWVHPSSGGFGGWKRKESSFPWWGCTRGERSQWEHVRGKEPKYVGFGVRATTARLMTRSQRSSSPQVPRFLPRRTRVQGALPKPCPRTHRPSQGRVREATTAALAPLAAARSRLPERTYS